MDEQKYLRAGAALAQRANDVGVIDDVGRELARLNVEDEDEDGHAAEDMLALVGKIAFHETVMSLYFQKDDNGYISNSLRKQSHSIP